MSIRFLYGSHNAPELVELEDGGSDPHDPKNAVLVFNLRTNQWISGERLNSKKELRLVRSLSSGNWQGVLEYLEEDMQMCGELTVPLEGLDDGYYTLGFHEHRDWETGIVDEVEHYLSPYTPPEK